MLFERTARCALSFALAASSSVWCAPFLDLDVSLDPATQSLAAKASITTTALALDFYLAENFVVQSVELDGATVPTDRSLLDGLQRFQIDFPNTEKPQTVTVRYRGELHTLDTSISHNETLEALPAMASTEGAFLPGNSSWHPMLDTAFTFRLKTAVPDGYVAVAPGVPSDETSADGIRHASFTMKWPTEGIDMMVGPWSIQERRIRVDDTSVLLRTYFGSAESGLADSYLDATERFIKRYSREIGPYPYASFSVVSSPIPTGFGMPTLTYLGSQVLGYPFIREISLGHEVLHSWWGNGIRVDPVRGNWAEGLTTFMADYAYREDDSENAAMLMRHGWLRNYAALPAGVEQPLSAFRARHHIASAAIGYGKAAMMFHALRERLGKELFVEGIRSFWNEYRYVSASFDQLRDAFETASGLTLTDFFSQWLEQTGAPLIRVTKARYSDTGRGEIQLDMTQETTAFITTVPLHFHSDSQSAEKRVLLSKPAQTLNVTMQFQPSTVQVDPLFVVWRKLNPQEAPPILRDVIAAQSVQVMALEAFSQQAAVALADGFSEGRVSVIESPHDSDPNKPLLVAGSMSAIEAFLENAALKARPDQIRAGAVEVWIVPDATRKIVLIAIAPNARDELDWLKLGRRLYHFGRYAWVSIGAGGKTESGNWSIKSPLYGITN